MEHDFDIILINGEIIESSDSTHFFIVKNSKCIGGACKNLDSFLRYLEEADNIAITASYGEMETCRRIIPKTSILEYRMK